MEQCHLRPNQLMPVSHFQPGTATMYRSNYTAEDEMIESWLLRIEFAEYICNFIESGYDMGSISKMTPEDLIAIGITNPNHRRILKTEIQNLGCQLNGPWSLPDLSLAENLYHWLYLIKLEEYHDALCKQGYNTIDQVVSDLTWEDFEDVGIIKLGHQKRLILAIKKYKKDVSLFDSINSVSVIPPSLDSDYHLIEVKPSHHQPNSSSSATSSPAVTPSHHSSSSHVAAFASTSAVVHPFHPSHGLNDHSFHPSHGLNDHPFHPSHRLNDHSFHQSSFNAENQVDDVGCRVMRIQCGGSYNSSNSLVAVPQSPSSHNSSNSLVAIPQSPSGGNGTTSCDSVTAAGGAVGSFITPGSAILPPAPLSTSNLTGGTLSAPARPSSMISFLSTASHYSSSSSGISSTSSASSSSSTTSDNNHASSSSQSTSSPSNPQSQQQQSVHNSMQQQQQQSVHHNLRQQTQQHRPPLPVQPPLPPPSLPTTPSSSSLQTQFLPHHPSSQSLNFQQQQQFQNVQQQQFQNIQQQFQNVQQQFQNVQQQQFQNIQTQGTQPKESSSTTRPTGIVNPCSLPPVVPMIDDLDEIKRQLKQEEQEGRNVYEEEEERMSSLPSPHLLQRSQSDACRLQMNNHQINNHQMKMNNHQINTHQMKNQSTTCSFMHRAAADLVERQQQVYERPQELLLSGSPARKRSNPPPPPPRRSSPTGSLSNDCRSSETRRSSPTGSLSNERRSSECTIYQTPKVTIASSSSSSLWALPTSSFLPHHHRNATPSSATSSSSLSSYVVPPLPTSQTSQTLPTKGRIMKKSIVAAACPNPPVSSVPSSPSATVKKMVANANRTGTGTAIGTNGHSSLDRRADRNNSHQLNNSQDDDLNDLIKALDSLSQSLGIEIKSSSLCN